jgi:o-succinylbenzoate synthase
MRIAGVELVPYGCDLPGGFGGGGGGRWTERRGWLLRLESERGEIGQGEAAPLPGYSPDSLEEAEAGLARLREAAPSLELDPCLPVAPQIARWVAQAKLPSASARCAAETALLDLAGQRLGAPVSWLLRGGPGESSLPTARVLSSAPLVDAALEAWDAGHRTFKVKVGAADLFEAELAALAALRRRLPAAGLRIDVGGAWSAADAPARLRRLAELAPEFVEQPVAADALEGLRAEGLPPLAADESLQRSERARRIASSATGPVRVLVLKPSALGGPLACRELAGRARRAGLTVVVSHLLEGPVGFAAAAELALSLPLAGLACGLAPHPVLETWRARAWPPHSSGPDLRAQQRPGLGLPLVGAPS